MANDSNALRRTLVLYFVIIIALISALNFYSITMMWKNYRSTENMFNSVFYTTSLGISLDETHQELKNLLNYQEQPLAGKFQKKLGALIQDVKNLDGTMLEYAREADDMNAYYAFLKIQSGILSYGEKSEVLVARYQAGTDRAQLYEYLYSLKDDVDELKARQAELLFRQSVYTQKFYNLFEKTILKNTYLIVILTVSIISLALVLAFRFSAAVSDPIHRLVVYTHEIGKGNFEPIEKGARLNSEIATLFNAVDRMSGRLKKLIFEIEEKADIERRLVEEEVKNLKIENLLHQTEMQMLQSQINPHFLFNTLNMINTLTRIEGAERSGSMIESLSSLLRYIIKRDTNNTLLRDELAIIDDYMNIQLTRFGDKISYRKKIDESVLDVPLPPVSLQPFVENSIIHGLEPKLGRGNLKIEAEPGAVGERTFLELRIIDDGVGMQPDVYDKLMRNKDPRDKKHGLGIINSIKRLEMLFGEGVVTMSNEPDRGVTVVIRIPFDTEEVNSLQPS